MEKEQKRELLYIAVSAVIYIAALLLPLAGPWRLAAFLLPWLLCGYGVLLEAAEKLLHGALLDEDFLMAAASIGAFCIGEYPEAAAVMLLYRVGEFFEDFAEERSRRSVRALMSLSPETAVLLKNGEEICVAAEQVMPGDVILIRPGDRIGLDGQVLSGVSSLDVSALTGEPLPVSVSAGDGVRAGCIALDGVLMVRVTAALAESTVSRILQLVENASDGKSKSESFIHGFARIYTPIVVGTAAALALLGGAISGDWSAWLHRALVFLVVSCPCALVISVPMSFFAGIGAASRRGILFKGSGCMETLAKTTVAAFDKTGTLTRGRFSVAELHPAAGMDEERLLALAAAAENGSSHPIARAVAAAGNSSLCAENIRELPGLGVTAEVDGCAVCVGNEKLLNGRGCSVPEQSRLSGAGVYVAVDGCYAGSIAAADTLKPGTEKLVRALKAAGVKKCVMLSGDNPRSAGAVAGALGLDECYAALSPEDKAAKLRELKAGGVTAFMGDGINDAPVLACADVGIAMGALGSDAAVETADVVIMDDNPMQLVTAIGIARGTLAIVRQNIALALVVKLLVLALGAFGYAPLWLAVFADVGVCVLAVLNAMRALRQGRGRAGGA